MENRRKVRFLSTAPLLIEVFVVKGAAYCCSQGNTHLFLTQILQADLCLIEGLSYCADGQINSTAYGRKQQGLDCRFKKVATCWRKGLGWRSKDRITELGRKKPIRHRAAAGRAFIYIYPVTLCISSCRRDTSHAGNGCG